MKTTVFRVVSQGDVSYVASQKAEGGQLAKCVIRLKEFGGSKFGALYQEVVVNDVVSICK